MFATLGVMIRCTSGNLPKAILQENPRERRALQRKLRLIEKDAAKNREAQEAENRYRNLQRNQMEKRREYRDKYIQSNVKNVSKTEKCR